MSSDRGALDRAPCVDQCTEMIQRVIPELSADQARELAERCYPIASRMTPKGLSVAATDASPVRGNR